MVDEVEEKVGPAVLLAALRLQLDWGVDEALIEAPLDELDSAIERTQYLMKKASQIILFGFELNSDVKVVRYPDRYMDKRGKVMWNKVTSLLSLNPQNKPVALCHTT